MDAVTYPNPKVAEFLQSSLIPLQVKSDTQPLATDYRVKWTPNLLILDAAGKDHHRIIGFLPPVDFVGSILLGMGKTYFDVDRYEEGIATFDKVIAEYGQTGSAPEAVYLRGVAQYKSTHVALHLKEAFQLLQSRYSRSEWAKRAYPYWLL